MDDGTTVSSASIYGGDKALWTNTEPSALGDFVDSLQGLSPDSRVEVWSHLRARIEATAGYDPEYTNSHRAHPLTARMAPSAVVYYARFGDRVKIGTTINLANRMAAIPHDEVLATEPGDRTVERDRHQRFADLHVIGEWYRYEEPLVTYIASL